MDESLDDDGEYTEELDAEDNESSSNVVENYDVRWNYADFQDPKGVVHWKLVAAEMTPQDLDLVRSCLAPLEPKQLLVLYTDCE